LTTPSRESVPLALAVLLAAVTAAPAASLGGSSVDRVVLDNGLTVLLLPEPGSRLVSVGMMYTVGAKNEAAGTTGLAHYAEHMNFRATARFPGHEITEAITRRGGRWTGYTWIDQTFFQTTLAKEHLGLALDIEADRMGGALYDEKDFASERTSVVAELRSYDDAHSLLYDEVLGAALLVHPYRNNTIGWLTDVEAVTRDAAYSFYRRFYTPRNAVLVVGGDFDRKDALAQIEAHFSARPPGDAPTHVATIEPPQSGERRVTVRKPGPRGEVLIAFPAPSLDDPDFPAMVLFDALFAGGKGLWFLRSYPERPDALLERAVVASGAAREVKTAFQASLYPYVYTLSATISSGDGLAAAEKALFGAVETASSLPFTGADLERARREVRAGMARDLDSLAGRVHQLAFFEVSGGYEHLAALESRLEATSLDAVRAFARARLTRDKATVGWYWPTPGVPVFASGQAPARAVGTTTETREEPAPARPGPAAPATFRLANGLTVHVTSNPASRLVALRGRIDAGTIYEPRPGMAALAERLYAGATRAEGSLPLAFGLDDDPAETEAARFITFHASGLPDDLEGLARAVARGFGAAESGFDAARRAALERARAAETDTSASMTSRARALLFPSASPLARPAAGASESLESLDAPGVLAFFRHRVVPARTELSIAGPLPLAEVERRLGAAFKETPSPGARPSPSAAPATLVAAKGPAAWTVVPVPRPDAAQNEIDVVVAGDRSRPHDPAATSLLLYLLGETFYSGRLGRALVEPGLVYSVQATLEEAPGLPGYLRVRTAAARENTGEVLRRIRAILEDAAHGSFTAAELAEAKDYLRGKAARAGDGALLAATRALASSSPGPGFETISLEQLNDTARRLLSRGAPLAFVGGPGE